MNGLEIFTGYQTEYLQSLWEKGYGRLTIRIVKFAFKEFEKFLHANKIVDVEGIFKIETLNTFCDWKLDWRKRRQYHPSYTHRVYGCLIIFWDWYFQNSPQLQFNRTYLEQKNQEFIASHPHRYPRWPIEITNKHNQFFDYLEEKLIFNLKQISIAHIDDFNKKCQNGFYTKRTRYHEHYPKRIIGLLEKYFLFLDFKNVATFKMPKLTPAVPNVLLDRFIETYLDFCANACGMAKTSIHRVKVTLCHFSKFLDEKGILNVAHINIGDVDQFISLKKNASFSSHITENSILRRFLKWLYLEGSLPTDISTLIITRRQYQYSKVPNFLSDDELKTLLDFDQLKVATNNVLAKTVVLLLLFTGIRIGEAAHLELDNINWDQKTLLIKNRKNRRDLLIPIGDYALETLRTYLTHWRPKKPESKKIFFTVRAPCRPVTSSGLIMIILRYFKRLKINGGAHRLRHTFAQRLLESGSGIEEVRSLLGQESANSTRIYAKTSMSRMRKFVVGNEE